jgi:hypothetical protein
MALFHAGDTNEDIRNCEPVKLGMPPGFGRETRLGTVSPPSGISFTSIVTVRHQLAGLRIHADDEASYARNAQVGRIRVDTGVTRYGNTNNDTSNLFGSYRKPLTPGACAMNCPTQPFPGISHD